MSGSPETENALVLFGADLVTQDGTLSDSLRVLFARALMDIKPEVAAELLAGAEDTRSGITSLFDWIKNLKGKSLNSIRKLEGLIDTAQSNDQLVIVLEKIEQEPSGNDGLMELANDPRRLELLFNAAQEKPHLTRGLLRACGYLRRKEGVIECEPFGLLHAAACFNNTESYQLILNQANEASMTAEMFVELNRVLIKTFKILARYGNVDLLERIISLVQKLESDDSKIAHEKEQPASDATGIFRETFGLPDDSDALSILLVGKNLDEHGAISNLEFAVTSGNQDAIDFITKTLMENEGIIDVLGRALHKNCHAKSARRRRRRGQKSAGQKAYQFADSLEDFLRDFTEAAKSKGALSNFLVQLFPKKRPSTPLKPLSKEEEAKTELPAKCNQDAYEALVHLMSFLDGMSQTSGKGKEWARKLTLLFNDVEKAKQYIQNAVQWATEGSMEAAHSPTIWRHRTYAYQINWPDDLIDHINTATKGVSHIDCIEVAMGFDLPSETFDAEPWSDLLIQHPETSRYLAIAPEIEAYLQEHSQAFPKTIEQLRKVILEVEIQRCQLSDDIANRLRGRLQLTVEPRNKEGKRQFRTGVLTTTLISPEAIGCIERLSVMGILRNSSIFRLVDEEDIAYVVMDEEGFPEFAEELGIEEEDAMPWQTRESQIILAADQTFNELWLTTAILADRSLPVTLDEQETHLITLDLREMDEKERLTLLKQLCATVVRLVPDKHLQSIVSPASKLKEKQGEALREEMLGVILSADTLETILGHYGNNNTPPIEFRGNDVIFRVRTTELASSEMIKNSIEGVHEFINWCLSIIQSNDGEVVRHFESGGNDLIKMLVQGYVSV